MAEYYLHKAGFQELGSIGSDGKPQRGRYFLVSKKCLDFFPHLSSVIMNDSILLTVISMFPDRQSEKVVCTLDYHNQKHAVFNYTGKHPRDEYRFYLNNNIDPNLYYETEDIVVFEKIITNDGEFIYSLTRIPKDHPNYNYLDRIINDFKASRGGHALYNGVLDFIKKPEITENEIITVSEKAAEVINKVSDDLAQKEENSEVAEIENSMGASFFNSSSFRDFVLNAYDYRCAITRKVIRYNDFINLEAAHVKPNAHDGKYLPCNGIALSRDLHFAFDKGFFTIDDNHRVLVAPELEGNEFYNEFNGHEVYVPPIDFFRPHPIFLQYHREHIYRSFQQIRRIQ